MTSGTPPLPKRCPLCTLARLVRGAWCVGSSLGAVIKHAHSQEAAHTNHSEFGKCPSSPHLRAVIRRSAVRAAWQHLVDREPRFLRPTEARREVPPSSKTGKDGIYFPIFFLFAWNQKKSVCSRGVAKMLRGDGGGTAQSHCVQPIGQLYGHPAANNKHSASRADPLHPCPHTSDTAILAIQRRTAYTANHIVVLFTM